MAGIFGVGFDLSQGVKLEISDFLDEFVGLVHGLLGLLLLTLDKGEISVMAARGITQLLL